MSDVLKEAQSLYTEALDAQRAQRQQISEDLSFSDPSDPQQWDVTVKLQRETDPGGKRPCLVMDQTSQYCQQVSGQIEKQTPSLHAIPVGGGASKDAAEQIDGRFRHVEYASRATQHYTRALTSASRVGVGYLVARPEYIDRALGWQEPRIGSEPDPLKVVFDPWSVETDGSDATFGYILTPMSVREFERRWPKKDQLDFGDTESQKRSDTRKSVLIAEQWFKEDTTVNRIIYTGADGEEASDTEEEFWSMHQRGMIPPQSETPRTYKDKTTAVHWRRMSGADVLEESEYPADSIGIVPVYGYVGFADGRMTYCGIPRRARNPQQAYNFHASELMMPGAQILASKRALAGTERIWDRAAVERRAFLPFNDMDEDGAISAPTLIKTGASLVDHAGGCERALRDIEAAVAMYRANIGAPSNETSGVAIDARKQQGEASNAHFPSHLAASMGQLGNIIRQMDQRLSDTRRKQSIIGIDGSPGSVTVDPDQSDAFMRLEDGSVSINPKVGQYGVRVVVGASYSTQRSETNAAFSEIMRGNPGLAPTVAPFWAQTLDFPGSDKFAQAMAAMAPAPVKAIIQPEGEQKGPDPAAMAQQLQQLQEALKEALQHAHDAQQEADQARLASEDKDEADKVAWYKAETDRLKVTGANEAQIQAIVSDMVNQMLSGPAPLPGDPEPGPDAWQQHAGLPEAQQAMQQPMPQQMPEAMPEPMQQEPEQPVEETQESQVLHSLQVGQHQIAQALGSLIELAMKPRKRVPVRDQNGDILHVTDAIDDTPEGAN